MNDVDEERELLVEFMKFHWPESNSEPYVDQFLEEKRKHKFSLICADGVEVNDPEQIVWTITIDGPKERTAKDSNLLMVFSTKEAAELALKKTILEKNGISKEDCEQIFNKTATPAGQIAGGN